ncbi:MAG: hypothetical protein K2J55_06445 [Eubacterium sp.]|nr:hypothetical protein [Eubacterium sp.]
MDFIENFYYAQDEYYTDMDEQKISRSAISTVLPLILKNDLTERQRSCLTLKYVNNLNQSEIAGKLNLSQPTVCRHIATAKDIVNNRLAYCLAALSKANKMWIEFENAAH